MGSETEERALRARIHAARAETIRLTALLVGSLDVDTRWADIARLVHEAGVPRGTLTVGLSCGWSTYERWMAGRTAPGPVGRRGIRAVMVTMLDRLRIEQEAASLKATT